MSNQAATPPIKVLRGDAMAIIDAVRPYSMVPDDAILFAMKSVLNVVDRGVSGAIVECGTWRGGSSMAMMLTQKKFLGAVQRPVYMLDSFEGLPVADERDGQRARLYQEQKLDPSRYYDNCRA